MAYTDVSCVVVETAPGKYLVTGMDAVEKGHWEHLPSIWIPPGDYYNTPHIVVKGIDDVSADDLSAAVQGIVMQTEQNLAVHKGWAPPKLEKLADIIKKDSRVNYAVVKRP